jgi:atypical dual specificity phosphatase
MNLPDSISWVHVPIQDNTPPTLEQIHYVVALIDKAKMEGRRISVHCAWGRGRTGTMLACYLAKQLNLSADEAIARIRQLRPGSVDTEEQENVIRSFVNEMSAAHK